MSKTDFDAEVEEDNNEEEYEETDLNDDDDEDDNLDEEPAKLSVLVTPSSPTILLPRQAVPPTGC